MKIILHNLLFLIILIFSHVQYIKCFEVIKSKNIKKLTVNHISKETRLKHKKESLDENSKKPKRKMSFPFQAFDAAELLTGKEVYVILYLLNIIILIIKYQFNIKVN